MKRFELVATLLALACGSRTELDVKAGAGDASTPSGLRIALFGDPGVYDESAFIDFLAAHGTVTRTQTDGAPLTSDALAAFDLVILDDLVRDYTHDEAITLAQWVAAGGGLLSLTGYHDAPSDWIHPSSLLAGLGVAYQPPLLVAGASPGAITQFAGHPITKDLTSVVFYGGYSITHTGPLNEVAFTDGLVVGGAQQHGAGRVFVWGDEWVEYTSSFSSSQTKQFWTNALAWLHPAP